jgi:hypothetical protein
MMKKTSPRTLVPAVILLLAGLLPLDWAHGEELDRAAWSDSSRFWAATSAVALANDWMTTRDLTQRYQEGYWEANPLLGRNPSQAGVDLHFALVIPLIYGVADLLDDDDRVILLKTITVTELVVGVNNLRLGLHWRF